MRSQRSLNVLCLVHLLTTPTTQLGPVPGRSNASTVAEATCLLPMDNMPFLSSPAYVLVALIVSWLTGYRTRCLLREFQCRYMKLNSGAWGAWMVTGSSVSPGVTSIAVSGYRTGISKLSAAAIVPTKMASSSTISAFSTSKSVVPTSTSPTLVSESISPEPSGAGKRSLYFNNAANTLLVDLDPKLCGCRISIPITTAANRTLPYSTFQCFGA